METSRVFCMRVDPLYADNDRDYTWRTVVPVPSLCVCGFEPELIGCINRLRGVLEDNGLSVVSKQVMGVEWFHKTTKRFHLDIKTLMNVTESSVYFSGWHSPYKSPCFQTTELPLTEVIESAKHFKSIDLENIRQPMAKGLMEKILMKEKILQKRDELHAALMDLEDALVKIDDSSVEIISTDVEGLSGALLKEVSNQNALIEQMQLEIDDLNRKLVRRCFGVSYGDWIVCDGSDYTSKRVRLQLSEVYYYDNKLWLSGPIITQQGKIGKRTETIAISISPNEHPE